MMLHKMKGAIIANAIHESQLADNEPAIPEAVSGVAAARVALSVDDSVADGESDD